VTSGWSEFVADALSRAETLAQKALARDPGSTAAHRLLSLVHLNRGHVDLALSQTGRALGINPSDAESYVMRGDIPV
jgi:Tfp pilus assembly protein PilF